MNTIKKDGRLPVVWPLGSSTMDANVAKGITGTANKVNWAVKATSV